MELHSIAQRLNRLLNEDPCQAITEALNLPEDLETNLIKATTFVDAGCDVNDYKIVLKGVDIFRNALLITPKDPAIEYNLANGLVALSRCTDHKGFSWYQDTEDFRLEARQNFYSAATASTAPPELKSRSFCNLGIILGSSYRWVEAYDFYMMALNENPKNAVASAAALDVLEYALEQGLGDPELISKEIKYLANSIRENIDAIFDIAGSTAAKGIKKKIKNISPEKKNEEDDSIKNNSYERFIIKNNLALSLTIHSHIQNSEYLDNINIPSVITKDGSAIPEIFAMLNTLKSDYILAREIFFHAYSRLFKETGSYNDTLDYACYGLNESALTLSQRSALDILDKIAVATLAYLEMEGAKSGSFKSAWFETKRKGKNIERSFNSKVLKELEKGNTALLALTEASRDISNKMGFLSQKQISRNSSTHRFTILHDVEELPKSSSGCIEHFNHDAFSKEALYTLKLVRSSIIYFIQMITIRERRISYTIGESIPQLYVPSYAYIRGLNN